MTHPSPPEVPSAEQASSSSNDTGEAKTPASLAILRSALAQERQRTTELRNELDEARIALAFQQEQFLVVREERDLWAKRAGVLATLMIQKAAQVNGHADQTDRATVTTQDPSSSNPSIRIVA
jgi:hypothetical protein